jgi:hypothetical protein
MTTMLHDKVAGYAAEVRRHLADLGPEVVDELTEGLEADLAEELAERTAVGQGPAPEAAGEGGENERVLDLSTVFGPAPEYAAELRAAAGLAPAAVFGPPRRSLRTGMVRLGRTWRGRGEEVLDEIRRLPGGRWALESVVLLRPAWWLVRGWVWYVPVSTFWFDLRDQWVPRSGIAFLWLLVTVLVSIAWGRGDLHGRRPVRVALTVLSAAAAVAAVPFLANAATQTHWRERTVYLDVPAGPQAQAKPVDGVIVGGMYVSNLYVYDAEGNPLSDVQIVDDRGRPVRTITDGTTSDWALPGVSSPWAFAPRLDTSGRERWNVYPLAGAPSELWAWEEGSSGRVVDPAALREPPVPFAKAPALVPAGAAAGESAPGTGVATTGSSTAPAPSPTPAPAPSPTESGQG